jgi:hypothetical protein
MEGELDYESGGQEFESLRVHHLCKSRAWHCEPAATQKSILLVRWMAEAC